MTFLTAGSLVTNGTTAFASTPAPPLPVVQPNPWAVLAVLSGGAPAAAICGEKAQRPDDALNDGGWTPAATDVAPHPTDAAALASPPESASVTDKRRRRDRGCVLPPLNSGTVSGGSVDALSLRPSPLLVALVALVSGAGLYAVINDEADDRPNSPA